MQGTVRMLVLGSPVAVAILVATACNGDGGAGGCQVDTDCPTSYTCSANVCTPPVQTVGLLPNDGGTGATCANDNASCTVESDCCSRVCTSNVCASSVTSTQPTCTGPAALCQSPDDCCTGLTCTKGVCQ